MKPFLFILGAFILIVVPVSSQTACVPDANASTGNPNAFPFGFPSSSYKATSRRFMEILEAQYLPGMPVKITEVAFTRDPTTYPSPGNAPLIAPVFQLRMSHTTVVCPASLNFADWSGPCPTELISTTSGYTYLAAVNTWTPMGVKASFGYDGQRNICLEIRFQNATSGAFSCHSGDGTTVPAVPRLVANSSTANNYSAVSGRKFCNGGLKVCLTYTTKCILFAPDTVNVGTAGSIQILGMPPGDAYQIAASMGQAPLNLGTCTLYLTLDGVFLMSVQAGPPIFAGYAGIIPASGSAVGTLKVPSIPALIGIYLYHAAVAYNARGITCCTNTAGLKIVP